MVPALALYKRVCTASFCELEIKKSKVSEYQSAPLYDNFLYLKVNNLLFEGTKYVTSYTVSKLYSGNHGN